MTDDIGPALAASARDWLDVPFRHQGYQKTGCDCIGLIAGVAAPILGFNAAEVMGAYTYRRWPDQRMLLSALNAWCRHVGSGPGALEYAHLGDMLLFRVNGRPQHMGLVVSRHPFVMVHSFAPARRVVEHAVDPTWHGRLLSVWQLKPIGG